MDDKIIRCLKLIQEDRDQGSVQTESDFLNTYKEYSPSNLKYYRELGLLGKEGNCPHLTPLGYQYLNASLSLENSEKLTKTIESFSKSSDKISSETLKHTKVMKNLTWWILGITVFNLITIIIQILIAKGVF
jgi:hypothetical protein